MQSIKEKLEACAESPDDSIVSVSLGELRALTTHRPATKERLIQAINSSPEVAQYNGFIDSQTGHKPVGFTKRQASDLKAGYGDGTIQGALLAAKFFGIELG